MGIPQIRNWLYCSFFSLVGVVLSLLHLFIVEQKPKYVSGAHGTPVGSEAFLPSIVRHHDMAHLNLPSVFTPFLHTAGMFHHLVRKKTLFTITKNSHRISLRACCPICPPHLQAKRFENLKSKSSSIFIVLYGIYKNNCVNTNYTKLFSSDID